METHATGDDPTAGQSAAEAQETDLGRQVRAAVWLLFRRFRSERPEGGWEMSRWTCSFIYTSAGRRH
ncbi:hypothetical protein [Streptomyces sp. NPDC058142]|uniref:hypothetical protein n=1 Tax=Streptomyces sp. NPDC058142 TaxID=3346355 RepID=UPI0036E99B6C